MAAIYDTEGNYLYDDGSGGSTAPAGYLDPSITNNTSTTGGAANPTVDPMAIDTATGLPNYATNPSNFAGAASSGTPWSTDLVKGFNSLTGLSLTGSQLAGLGLGAMSLYGSLSSPAYNPKSATQLLSQQPSNTPGAFTQAQMSAMQTPIRSGNQIQRTSAAAMPSSVTPGVGALTQAPRAVQPYQFNSAVSNPIVVPPKKFAEGGEVPGNGPLTQAQPFVGYVSDDSGGQADLIDAKLSGGEYVMDAESVAMLGDGNNSAGAAKLDQLREELRAQKRAAPNGEIAPPAQGALSYMKGGLNG
jgi:hypothetical protein